jgi:hypothetical protein
MTSRLSRRAMRAMSLAAMAASARAQDGYPDVAAKLLGVGFDFRANGPAGLSTRVAKEVRCGAS